MKHSQIIVRYSKHILSPPLISPDDSYRFFMQIWDKKMLCIQEQVYIVYLNDNNEAIGWRCLNTGTTNETLFAVRLAVSIGLNCLASKTIIAHNHPFGILKPSAADVKMTEKIIGAFELIDISLLDHLIVSDTAYYSFTNNDLL